MLVCCFEFFGGKRLFFGYLRVTGRWRKLLGSFSTYFEPNPTSWCRVMAKKAFEVNGYLHNAYLHLSAALVLTFLTLATPKTY